MVANFEDIWLEGTKSEDNHLANVLMKDPKTGDSLREIFNPSYGIKTWTTESQYASMKEYDKFRKEQDREMMFGTKDINEIKSKYKSKSGYNSLDKIYSKEWKEEKPDTYKWIDWKDLEALREYKRSKVVFDSTNISTGTTPGGMSYTVVNHPLYDDPIPQVLHSAVQNGNITTSEFLEIKTQLGL